MAAYDNATVTIDTDEMNYTDQNGIESKVNNAETFTMELRDDGDESTYENIAGTLELADGRKLRLDSARSSFRVASDATAKVNAGSIWVEEDNGYFAEWKVRTVTIDDVDEPTSLTATLERVDNPSVTMTLTTITVAQ